MSAILEAKPSFEPTFMPSEEGALMQRFKDGVVLGGMALWAYHAERSGLDSHLPVVLKQAAESMGHPVLGFMGAWAGTEVASNRASETTEGVGLLGAIGADLFTEEGQDIITNTIEATRWYHHPFESTKDLAFALVGAAYFLHQTRKAHGQQFDMIEP